MPNSPGFKNQPEHLFKKKKKKFQRSNPNALNQNFQIARAPGYSDPRGGWNVSKDGRASTESVSRMERISYV